MANRATPRSNAHAPETYLFLQPERNASHGFLLDSLHQVSREAGNLVSKSLCLDLADVIDDSLIYMEVVGQPAHAQTRHLAQRRDGPLRARPFGKPLTFRSTSR